MENSIKGRSLTWALDFPGCSTYGAGSPAAMAALPGAYQIYREWVLACGGAWITTAKLLQANR